MESIIAVASDDIQDLSLIHPSGLPHTAALNNGRPESPSVRALIEALNLRPHMEGGYFTETDRSPLLIHSPFPSEAAGAPLASGTTASPSAPSRTLALLPPSERPDTSDTVDRERRAASSTIFYLLAPSSPVGYFHRNRCRILHSLHRGRGRYVVVKGSGPRAGQVESFVVGHDVTRGERCQWVVEAGDWKASFLLPDEKSDDITVAGPDEGAGKGAGRATESREGLLITEVASPGFEYHDHDFLTALELRSVVGSDETARQLTWLVRNDESDALVAPSESGK